MVEKLDEVQDVMKTTKCRQCLQICPEKRNEERHPRIGIKTLGASR